MNAFYELSPFGKWLSMRGESATEFARRTFISAPTVYKAIKGKPIRCSTIKKILRFAKNLEEKDFVQIDFSFKSFE